MIRKERVQKILVISLSNLGDVILTTPVVDALGKNFKAAAIDVLVGGAGKMVFEKNPLVKNIIKYDKRARLRDKLSLIKILRAKKYDLVVDLRNTLIPFLVGARYKTGLGMPASKRFMHKRDAHLARLSSLGVDVAGAEFILRFDNEDNENIEEMLKGFKARDLIAIAPGAKSDTKRWPEKNFAALAKLLSEDTGAGIVLVGDQLDKFFTQTIASGLNGAVIDLCGKTSLNELAALLKKCKLLVTNDSAPLHVASALGLPCVAIFGPTDPAKYGPVGGKSAVVNVGLSCSPCEKAQCSRDWECMRNITPEMVFKAAKDILEDGR